MNEQKEKLIGWLRENKDKSDRQMVRAMSHKLLDYANTIDTLHRENSSLREKLSNVLNNYGLPKDSGDIVDG